MEDVKLEETKENCRFDSKSYMVDSATKTFEYASFFENKANDLFEKEALSITQRELMLSISSSLKAAGGNMLAMSHIASREH